MLVSELAKYAGKAPENLKDCEITGFCNDSRILKEGQAFVAIRTEQADGNDYLSVAKEKGASAFIASSCPDGNSDDYANLFLIKNPIRFLGDAAGVLLGERVETRVAVTGSAGKTTTKELIALLLELSGETLVSKGNYNNTIGLPMTVLEQLDHPVTFFVTEMGMSYPGEIQRLVEIVRPDMRVWLNVLTAHIGNFSGIEGLRDAKAEILGNREADDIVIYNHDDLLVKSRVEAEAGLKYSFGATMGADLRIVSAKMMNLESALLDVEYEGRMYRLHHHLAGLHHSYNVAAAVLTALTAGVKMEEAQRILLDFRPLHHRGQLIQAGPVSIYDDCYNSNPDAVKQVLSMFHEVNLPGRKVVVLGDMLELGQVSNARHREIGVFITGLRFDETVFYGDQMKSAFENCTAKCSWFEDTKSVANHVAETAMAGDTILVKASRGMHGEEVIDKLREKFE